MNTGDVASCILFTKNKPSVYVYPNTCPFRNDNYTGDNGNEDNCFDPNCPYCQSSYPMLTMDISNILEGKLIKNYKL